MQAQGEVPWVLRQDQAVQQLKYEFFTPVKAMQAKKHQRGFNFPLWRPKASALHSSLLTRRHL
eukprot:1136978-Pelagomonas_calceolata.AAC.2